VTWACLIGPYIEITTGTRHYININIIVNDKKIIQWVILNFTRCNYGTVGPKKSKLHIPQFFFKLNWQHSRLHYMLLLTILSYINTFCWTVSKKLHSQDLTLVTLCLNSQSPITPTNYVKLQWHQSSINYMTMINKSY